MRRSQMSGCCESWSARHANARRWLPPLSFLLALVLVSVMTNADCTPAPRPRQLDSLMGQLRHGPLDANSYPRLAEQFSALGPVAVLELSKTLEDPDPDLCARAAHVLELMGPRAQAAAPALIRMLERQAVASPNPGAYTAASLALRAIGGPAVPHLARALGTTPGPSRFQIAQVLYDLGPRSRGAVPVLRTYVHSSDPDMRSEAARVLGAIGPAARNALPDLLGQLRVLQQAPPLDQRNLVSTKTVLERMALTNAISGIGDAAVDGVLPALHDRSKEARRDAAIILGMIRPVRDRVVAELVRSLRDDSGEVCGAAGTALGEIGPPAIPALMSALRDPRPSGYDPARSAIARAFGEIGPPAIAPLLRELGNPRWEVRSVAGESLGLMRHPALPHLLRALGSADPLVREGAAYALVHFDFGFDTRDVRMAVGPLTVAARDGNTDVRAFALRALAQMTDRADTVLPTLTAALRDKEPDVRESAASALASFGQHRQVILPLVTALRDESQGVRIEAMRALANTSEALQEGMERLSPADLQAALTQLRQAAAPEYEAYSGYGDVRRAVAALDALRRARESAGAQAKSLAWLRTHPSVLAWLAYPVLAVLCTMIWLVLLWARPAWLHRLDRRLPAARIDLGPVKEIGLSSVLMLAPFRFHGRVLDAWVSAHAHTVARRFAEIGTVRDRQTHVQIPVNVDQRPLDQPSAVSLRYLCSGPRFCILICGEGGAGKTSLACQLAKWAMNVDGAAGLMGHRALPILIEQSLPPKGSPSVSPLMNVIGRQLELLTGEEEIDLELIRRLLAAQRLLLVVDRYSELDESSRACIRPGYDPDLRPNAMVVTARNEVGLDNTVTAVLEPLRVDSSHLVPFLVAYLGSRRKQGLYSDVELFDACANLSRLVGNRGVTPLLAKLYAEYLIARKEAPSASEPLQSVPELILSYLNWINRLATEREPDNRTVHRLMKAVSWVCIEDLLAPGEGRLAAIRQRLAQERDLDRKLSYLARKLRLIDFVGPAEDRVRVNLDPLAEYLGAMYIAEAFGRDEPSWRQLFKRAQKRADSWRTAKGFMAALLDCCEGLAPGAVPLELVRREAATEHPCYPVIHQRDAEGADGCAATAA